MVPKERTQTLMLCCQYFGRYKRDLICSLKTIVNISEDINIVIAV